MVLIGIIALLLGLGGAGLAVVGARNGSGNVTVEALGFSREAGALELAAYGAGAALLFCVGWALVAAGVRRRAKVRRDERESAHIAEIERRADAERDDNERRFEEASLRGEDLRRRSDDLGRREKELSTRHDGLDRRDRDLEQREQEFARHQQEWRQQQPPSVADIVTGRAEGNVHDGTAAWVDPTAKGSAPTEAIGNAGSASAATEEMPRADGRPGG